MTAPVEDPTLPVPPPPPPVGAADDLEVGTDGTGTTSAFHLAGSRGVLAGSDRGVDALWLWPRRVIRALHVAGAPPAPVRVTPVGAERRIDVDGAAVVERMVVARDAPLAFLEWRAGDRGATLDLSWEVDLATDPAAPAQAREALRWSRTPAGGLGVGLPGFHAVFALHPEAALEVTPAPDARPGLRVRATAALVPGSALRLGVAAGPPGLLDRAVRMLGRPAVAATARRGFLSRAAAERLALDDPDAGAGEALARAILGLDALRADVPGVGRSFLAGYPAGPTAGECASFRTADAVAAAHATLASGDADAAADTLALLARRLDGDGRVPGEVRLSGEARGGTPGDTAAFLRLAARHLAWTGDLGAARRWWPAVERALGSGGRDPAALLEAPGGADALRALVPAAEELGATALAGRLRHAIEGAPAGPPPDPGYSDPDPTPCPGGAAALARTVGDAVEGLLGAEPDAPRGRLVLRPRPGPRRRFHVRHLPLGDAALGVEYTREERDGGAVGVHTFGLVQERGAVPVTVVLEPVLPGSRVREARVDGVTAELEPRPVEGGWRVPVQVVLDHRRSVVVELEQPVH